MSSLDARLAARLDSSTLLAIAPKVSGARAVKQIAIVRALGDMLSVILEAADAATELRIEHLIAQAAHESDGFCTLVEYASGAAYEGRDDLGNIRSGDGVRFKGRGPIQLTGRANYHAFTAWMRRRDPACPDFEADPQLVATWPWAGWSLAFYWSSRPGLNVAADRDDLVAVTKLVNGGRNGLVERAAYLAKAKIAVVILVGDMLSKDQQFPVLRRGMSGSRVEVLQQALRAAGHYLLSIDGIFGAGTEAGVRMLQRAHGLLVNGVVDSITAAALSPYLPAEDTA